MRESAESVRIEEGDGEKDATLTSSDNNYYYPHLHEVIMIGRTNTDKFREHC